METPETPDTFKTLPDRRWTAAGVGLAVAVLYLWGLGSFGFLDPDEGMYAEIAWEMLASGDWIVPRFNGIPYIEKPPLMYWLTAGSFAVFGLSEFSARLWKVLPLLGTVGLSYALGRRLFSECVGVLSGLILSTMLGTFLFSRITQMDSLLVLGITLSAVGVVAADRPTGIRDAFAGQIQAFWEVGSDPLKIGWAAGLYFWSGIAIGVMSKGLPGLAIPFGLLILWCTTTRSVQAVRRIRPVVGPLALLVLTIPWHVAAAMKVPGFFAFYIVDNQFLRFFGSRAYLEDQQSPLGTLAFLGVTVIALFPWTPYLAAALTGHGVRLAVAGWRRWFAVGLPARAKVVCPHPSPLTPHDSRMLFLLSWAALIIGGFSLSSFKLEYYTLPAFPALAILTAAFLGGLDEPAGSMGNMDGTPRGDASTGWRGGLQTLRVWIWVAVVGGLLFTTGVAWALWAGFFSPENIARGLALWATNYRIMLEQGIPVPMVSGRDIGLLLLTGGLIWTAGYAAALGWLHRGRILPGALAVMGIGTVLCALASGVLGQVESHHSLKPLAGYLNGVLRSADIVVHERGLEKGGGLLFYTGRRVLVLNGTQGDLEFGSRLPGYERAFIDTEAFRTLWQGAARVFLVTHLPRALSAISAASAPTPVLVARTGTRWLYANSAP